MGMAVRYMKGIHKRTCICAVYIPIYSRHTHAHSHHMYHIYHIVNHMITVKGSKVIREARELTQYKCDPQVNRQVMNAVGRSTSRETHPASYFQIRRCLVGANR